MKPKELYYIYCSLHPTNHEGSALMPVKFASYVSEYNGQYIFSETEEKRFTSYDIALEICEELNRTKPRVILDGKDGWRVATVCYPGAILTDDTGRVSETQMDLQVMPNE